MPESKPIICTLSSSELATRGSNWVAALTKADAKISDTPGGVLITLNGENDGLVEIQELVRAEQKCCAWMSLNLRSGRTGATLSITSESSEGTRLIREMVGSTRSGRLSST